CRPSSIRARPGGRAVPHVHAWSVSCPSGCSSASWGAGWPAWSGCVAR
ncbi:MAG: hypothetical protein AVDCRST_MAG07-2117, partial [uncultured Frankineae bacterium]